MYCIDTNILLSKSDDRVVRTIYSQGRGCMFASLLNPEEHLCLVVLEMCCIMEGSLGPGLYLLGYNLSS